MCAVDRLSQSEGFHSNMRSGEGTQEADSKRAAAREDSADAKAFREADIMSFRNVYLHIGNLDFQV